MLYDLESIVMVVGFTLVTICSVIALVHSNVRSRL
ncbi:hypothetical protein SAMN05444375_103213 [Segatella baroniae B14]|jgi:hypothetical protein|nr:hypothetical protein SAMN04487899_101240 [Segatella bryantii]SEA39204.1 hypothetical protein SAMN05216455_106208 [Segatella bryantii]SEP88863.1 hypothetical protein SAMN05444375_103213 [Segatella baroniae B14]